VQCVVDFGGFLRAEYGYVSGDQCCEEIASFSESGRGRHPSEIEQSEKQREEGG
jgi:hypothetical protein